MLIDLAESYTESLNKGGIPVIESAWEYIQSNEIESAFKQTLKDHENLINNNVKPALPLNDTNMKQLVKDIKKESTENFKRNTVGNINNSKNRNYLEKLKRELKHCEEDIWKKNKELCEKITKKQPFRSNLLYQKQFFNENLEQKWDGN